MTKQGALVVAVVAALLGASGVARAGTVTVEQHGGRNVRVFVPTTPAPKTSLVVMLHGCTQTPDAFADATRMDVIAEQNGFVVAYPEQPAEAIATRCFRWYEPAHQARGAGEPKDIADAADAIGKAHGVDLERVYVAGISAGAAMSVILGATYPDRFTAIGAVAGIEYKGATSATGAFSTTRNGGPDPAAQGALALAQMGAQARAVPAFVMHGTADGVVGSVNGDQVAAQWVHTNTLVLGEGVIDPVKVVAGTAGYPFTRRIHAIKASGVSMVEYYVVEGLGHAWPGGKDGGSYSDPSGPDASALLWAFFAGRTRTSPNGVPPAVLPDGGVSTPDGGAGGPGSSGGPAGPDAPRAPAADASGEGSDSGCGLTRYPARSTGAASVLALAAIAAMIRSRRARR